MRLGSFEIEVISDGTFALDGGSMFSVVPRVMWERYFEPDSHNRIRLGLNCLLVRTGRENILVDTGIGRKWDSQFRERYEIKDEAGLLGGLRARGLEPSEIDIVINTHLHFDHAGTNTVEVDGQVVPTFPRARYVVQRGEYEHASAPHERDRASYVARDFEPVAEAGQFDLVEGDAEIVKGVEVIKLPGHNRNHQCVKITSCDQTAFVFADLLPTTAHLPAAWVMSFDLYPVEVLEHKKRLIPQAVRENWAALFYHDPRTALGYLRESNGRVSVEKIS
ncbi:MAG TPA: MBL fold metallo-hydrolase [Blastocatellia bacterium]|nr:MBL fold metallo-hydrolase [Blastocatellia bacterium]